MGYNEYNEEEHPCKECDSCKDERCDFLGGAGIEDINEPFICMYFSPKN